MSAILFFDSLQPGPEERDDRMILKWLRFVSTTEQRTRKSSIRLEQNYYEGFSDRLRIQYLDV